METPALPRQLLHFARAELRWNTAYETHEPFPVGPLHSFRDPVGSWIFFEMAGSHPETGYAAAAWVGRRPMRGGRLARRVPRTDGYHPPTGLAASEALSVVRWARDVGPARPTRQLQRIWRVLYPKTRVDLVALREVLSPELDVLEAFLVGLPDPKDPVLAEYAVRPRLTAGKAPLTAR